MEDSQREFEETSIVFSRRVRRRTGEWVDVRRDAGRAQQERRQRDRHRVVRRHSRVGDEYARGAA